MVRLTQIVDRNLIIALQERLTDELEMSIVFEESTDWDMRIIEKRGDVLKACTDFLDLNEKGERGSPRCINSDTEAALKAREKLLTSGKDRDGIIVEFYICNGQFRNFVIPIAIGGDVLGNVYAGQFLVNIRKDSAPAKAVKEMESFHMVPPRISIYANLPEDGPKKIARDNDIDVSRWKDFEGAYEHAINNAKSLEKVVDAVYLLHQIATTISYLGNVYYFNNLLLRMKNILPLPLENMYSSKLEELLKHMQTISAVKPPSNYSSAVRGINEVSYDILKATYTYEVSYVKNLLAQLEGDDALKHVFDYTVALCQYELRQTEILLRKVSGKAIPFDKTLKETFDSVEKEFVQQITANMKDTSKLGDIRKKAETLRITLGKFAKQHQIDTKASVDDIEALFDLLEGEKYSLLTIKNEIIEKRVYASLPEPLHALRRALPLRYDRIYMNLCGISPAISCAVDAQKTWSVFTGEYGPVSMETEKILEGEDESNELEKCRHAIAELLNCEPAEVVLTSGTTEGIEKALSSIDFLSNEENIQKNIIVLSNLEHDAVEFCVDTICEKYKVMKRVIDLRNETAPGNIVEQILKISTEGNIRVVLLSHVTYSTGEILDVEKIIKEIQNKNPKVLFMVDGAQAVGNIPVDFSRINCEFYAADGHKWLMGSVGSGFLIVKKDWLQNNYQRFASYKSYSVSEQFRARKKSGEFYEPSTLNIGPIVALSSAVKKHLEIRKKMGGLYKHQTMLALKFRTMVTERLDLYDIRYPQHKVPSGIVCVSFGINLEFHVYETIRKTLDNEFRVVCRAIKNPPSLRFCISYLNSEKELEITVACLSKTLESLPETRAIKEKKLKEIEDFDERATEINIWKAEVIKKIQTRVSDIKKVLDETRDRTQKEHFLGSISEALFKTGQKRYEEKVKLLESFEENLKDSVNHVENVEEINAVEKKIYILDGVLKD